VLDLECVSVFCDLEMVCGRDGVAVARVIDSEKEKDAELSTLSVPLDSVSVSEIVSRSVLEKESEGDRTESEMELVRDSSAVKDSDCESDSETEADSESVQDSDSDSESESVSGSETESVSRSVRDSEMVVDGLMVWLLVVETE
jgi:hypothetical protein